MAAPENEGEAQRLRFGQWLLNAINSGSYRGLCWIDRANTKFRVPWKHNARKDITDSDLEVFRAWAVVSGRYEEGSEDPAKWKTNFRCALSSTRMFKLEEDNSKRGDDPHKVFSVVSATLQHRNEGNSSISNPVVDQQPAQQQLQVAGCAQQATGVPAATPQLELDPQDMASAIVFMGSTDPMEPSILEVLLQQCDISRDLGSLAPSWVPTGDTPQQDTVHQPHQEILHQPHQETPLQPYADPSQNSCFPPMAFPQCMPVVEQPTLDTYHPPGLMPPEEAGGCCGAQSSPGCGNAITGAMPLPCHLMEGTVPMQYPMEAAFFVPAASPAPQPQLPVDNPVGRVSSLDVTIYYRGKLFHQEEVEGSHCLLTYLPPNLSEVPCPCHVVHFPSPASVTDGKQRRITEEVLAVAGLQLEQRAYKVFATRREKCKVFWALSQQLEGVEDPPPNLLRRDQETPIFDFHEFCTELRDFRNGQRRRSPDFTIYLCFGQAFSKEKPKESKLILVKLVPKFCKDWYEQVLQEGASSLDSHTISLQLSDSFDLMELIEQYTMQLG